MQQLDLNLLKVFTVIAEEGSTTKAAQRLFITQPAVSRSLRKLREIFDDELFVRTRYGLKPTEKGQLLCDSIPNCLNELNQTFDALSEFNPASKVGQLKIAINPFLGQSLPALLQIEIHKMAPAIHLSIETYNELSIEKLVKGELDLAINYFPMQAPKEVIHTTLGSDSFQVLTNKQHPLQGQQVGLKALSEYPFATAIVPGWNEHNTLTQTVFDEAGYQANIAFRSEIINCVAEMATNSHMLFPASSLLSQRLFPALQPLQLDSSVRIPEVEFCAYYHYRHRQAPYYNWLITQLKNVLLQMQTQ